MSFCAHKKKRDAGQNPGATKTPLHLRAGDKKTDNMLAPALSFLFTFSGQLPDDWLTADVSFVFKKADINLAVYYRPVSLTCVLQIIRIYCGKAYTSTSRKAGKHIDLAVLGFSIAFDTVTHRRLMAKLDHYGTCGNLHSWIRNFLVDRTQQVVCEGQSSKSIKVASGVQQGMLL